MNTKEFKEIKALAKFCEDSLIDAREVYDNMIEDTRDFEVDNYRFIHDDNINKIQQEELSSDTYMLGCFSAWFLADILDAPVNAIELMQKAEAYEAIGEWVLESDKLEELQEEYSSMDGYGHHFNHYDGNEDEINHYHVFRIN